MKNASLAALAAVVALLVAAPAAQAQPGGPDWLEIALNDTQSIVPRLTADLDARLCESDVVYGNPYGRACDRVGMRIMTGTYDRFAYESWQRNNAYLFQGGFSPLMTPFGTYGYGAYGYDRGYGRYHRRGDISNRAVRNAVIIGDSVNAGLQITDMVLDHKRSKKDQRYREEELELRRQELELQRAQMELLYQQTRLASTAPPPQTAAPSAPPAPAPAPVPATSSIEVHNGTGCNLKVRDGKREFILGAGATFIVANRSALEAMSAKPLEGSCSLRTAFTGSNTLSLTCAG
ncbi:MAG TPA: hypothetical protein VD862_03000 [Candidatus Paceibacterota bacterium]|nr:hypothetical protein [Candidatus Paceibacterota bacterium]